MGEFLEFGPKLEMQVRRALGLRARGRRADPPHRRELGFRPYWVLN